MEIPEKAEDEETRISSKSPSNNVHIYYCLLTMSFTLKIIIKKAKNSKFCPSNKLEDRAEL